MADPEKCLSELPLLTEAERQQLLVEWNDTVRDYPKGRCVHELFEAQVEKSPDAIAAVHEDQEICYGELNRRSNQLAHYLQKLGVGAEVLVGVLMERSFEMVVAILGVLKAGGAYVPLDSAHPTGRLSFMLEDAKVSVLLTQEQLRDVLPKTSVEVVWLDADWVQISEQCEENLLSGVTAENVAYVIYTSGSTGLPKGVGISHGNVTRLFNATEARFHFNERDAWTLFHSYAFDFSVWELWGALLYGGRVIVVPYWVSRSPEVFYNLLRGEGITVLNQTPSSFYQLMSEVVSNAAEELQVRFLIFGGEALEPQRLKPFFDCYKCGVPELINMYGITETTVHVTYCPLQPAERVGTLSLIGRPLDDLQVYVLDQHYRLVPIGVPGAMYVSGAGLGRGYLKRPELTAERFIPNPFNHAQEARLYRTGDLARRLQDGALEYLGRIDQQVKIRGFRIELGEIESVLSQYRGLKDVVVIAREDTLGEKQLVGYVVADAVLAPTSHELREFLKPKLPEYMIPSAFVFLEALPLTPNGKVDRKALPAPDQGLPELEESYVAPRTPVEEVLAGIWAEVLGVERVGIYNNFFELGGHSLKATQVMARVREIFKVELPLRRLFETPTVAGFAAGIEVAQRTGLEVELPPIRSVSREGKLPLSFAQERLWFLDQLEPDKMMYISPMVIRLQGQVDMEILERSLTEIIGRHEVLRTTFPCRDDYPVQHIAPPAPVSLEPIDLSKFSAKQREREVRRMVREETRQRMTLDQGPLFRVQLVRLAFEEYLMIVIKHHIIFDGWSQRLFLREIATLYHSFAKNEPVPLAPLPCQYADYAVWQRKLLEGEHYQFHLKYWQEKLEGAPAIVGLPTDRPRGVRPGLQGARVMLRLPASLIKQVNALCRQEKVTMYMAMLAAFKITVHKWTGQSDIVIGTVIANRSKLEIENLIGCFIELLPIRSKLSANQTTFEFLQQVKEAVLDAYVHQEFPFAKIVEGIKNSRIRNQTPIYNIAFLMQKFGSASYPQDMVRFTHIRLAREKNTLSEVGSLLDLRFIVLPQERTGEMSLIAEYKTDLFNRDTITRVIHSFCVVLNQLGEDMLLAGLRLDRASELEALQGTDNG